MEKKQTAQAREACALCELTAWETLAERKTAIYARLLTDPSLAKAMEELSARHARRRNALASLSGEKNKTTEKSVEGDKAE